MSRGRAPGLGSTDPKAYLFSYIKKVRYGNKICWEWQGALLERGYGVCRIKGVSNIRAHRSAWMVFRGPIPDGENVLHKCDNRKCINPMHLFLGDQQDNVDDMRSKNRHKVGVQLPQTKFTEEIVRSIRKEYRSGLGPKLAKKYSTHRNNILAIVNFETWKHV